MKKTTESNWKYAENRVNDDYCDYIDNGDNIDNKIALSSR
jgi:hypothetical protein